jgi:hypothetical protein
MLAQEGRAQADLVASIDRQTDEGAVIAWCLEAVKDIQATIRAIDTKMGILLAALVLPLKDVAERFAAMHSAGGNVAAAIVIFATISYVLAIFVAIATLSGIGTAHVHVDGTPQLNTFYAGGLFKFNAFDAFFRRKAVRSSLSVAEFAEAVPKTCEQMTLDLSAEIMTLAYIRDLKVLRQRLAFAFTAGAFVLGAVGFVLTA